MDKVTSLHGDHDFETEERGPGKRHPLNFRTTQEIREALEDAAAINGRSLAAEAEARLMHSFKGADACGGVEIENHLKITGAKIKAAIDRYGAKPSQDIRSYIAVTAVLYDMVQDIQGPDKIDWTPLNEAEAAKAEYEKRFKRYESARERNLDPLRAAEVAEAKLSSVALASLMASNADGPSTTYTEHIAKLGIYNAEHRKGEQLEQWSAALHKMLPIARRLDEALSNYHEKREALAAAIQKHQQSGRANLATRLADLQI